MHSNKNQRVHSRIDYFISMFGPRTRTSCFFVSFLYPPVSSLLLHKPSPTQLSLLILSLRKFKKKKMVLKSIISAFKMEEDTKESKNRYPHASSSNEGTVIVGLKILAQISQSRSNVVVKPALVSTRSTSRRRSSASGDQYYCYLKSCYLCNKNLSLDKEVYMYR